MENLQQNKYKETNTSAHHGQIAKEDKDKIIKTGRVQRHTTFRGIIIRQMADLLTETTEAKRQWNQLSKVLKAKNCQPRMNIYPVSTLFKK